MSTRLILVWIYFFGCKFCHVLRGFIATDGGMLRRLTRVVMIFNAQICNVRYIAEIAGKR